MKNNSLLRIIMIVIAILPMAYLTIVWNTIPDTVAIHFDLKMQPDRMGNKSELWLVAGIMSAISLLMFFLFQYIHLIDPKRRNAPRSATFNKLAAGIVVFMAALNLLIIISAAKNDMAVKHFLYPLLGLLFAFIGNYMHNIKPNYFAGLRLPWTLNDADNWRKTHQLGGKLWFWGGLFLAIISLFINASIVIFVFVGVVVILVIVPAIYSYRLFKNKH